MIWRIVSPTTYSKNSVQCNLLQCDFLNIKDKVLFCQKVKYSSHYIESQEHSYSTGPNKMQGSSINPPFDCLCPAQLHVSETLCGEVHLTQNHSSNQTKASVRDCCLQLMMSASVFLLEVVRSLVPSTDSYFLNCNG